MNTITVVTHLINEARIRFGDVTALAVPADVWDRAMEEVADAGGQVGLDHCVVDGIEVRSLQAGADTAVAHLPSGEAHELTLDS